MILYVCRECGQWSDVALGEFIAKTWNNSMSIAVPDIKIASPVKSGVPCPEGHGFMVQVQPSDKLSFRVVDAQEKQYV